MNLTFSHSTTRVPFIISMSPNICKIVTEYRQSTGSYVETHCAYTSMSSAALRLHQMLHVDCGLGLISCHVALIEHLLNYNANRSKGIYRIHFTLPVCHHTSIESVILDYSDFIGYFTYIQHASSSYSAIAWEGVYLHFPVCSDYFPKYSKWNGI